MVLKDEQRYRLGFEDWSQQSLQARRRWLPRSLLENDVVVRYFAGLERGEPIEGPAAAQQRDASQERRRRWGLLPRAVKRAIERVHINLGPLAASTTEGAAPWQGDGAGTEIGKAFRLRDLQACAAAQHSTAESASER